VPFVGPLVPDVCTICCAIAYMAWALGKKKPCSLPQGRQGRKLIGTNKVSYMLRE